MPERRHLEIVPEESTPEGRRIWTCAACGKRAPWGSGWRWYGRYGKQREWSGSTTHAGKDNP